MGRFDRRWRVPVGLRAGTTSIACSRSAQMVGRYPAPLFAAYFVPHPCLAKDSLTAGNVATTIEVHDISAFASEVDCAPDQAFLRQRDDDFLRQRNEAQFRPAEPRRIGLSGRGGAGQRSSTEGPRKVNPVGLLGILVLDRWRSVGEIGVGLTRKVLQLSLAAAQKSIVIHDALTEFLNVIGRCAGG